MPFDPTQMIVIGVTLFFIGLGVLIWFAFKYLRATDDALWKTVEGEIAQRYIKKETRTRYDEDTGRREEHTVEKPMVVYTYTVNGEFYDSSNVVMGSLREASRRGYNRYRKGQQVTVYYDPTNPRVAHLEKPSTALTLMLTGAGGVMTVSGMVLTVLGLAS